jgi:hypothetical protein
MMIHMREKDERIRMNDERAKRKMDGRCAVPGWVTIVIFSFISYNHFGITNIRLLPQKKEDEEEEDLSPLILSHSFVTG